MNDCAMIRAMACYTSLPIRVAYRRLGMKAHAPATQQCGTFGRSNTYFHAWELSLIEMRKDAVVGQQAGM